jgi:thermitase
MGSLESRAIEIEAKQPQINTAGIIAPAATHHSEITEMNGTQPADDNEYIVTISPYSSSPELNDPYYYNQWGLSKIGIPYLPNRISAGEQAILVAVLDTGIDLDQEDLKGQVFEGIDLTLSGSVGDVNGHGTHIAGIIAGVANNEKGIAGIAPDSQLLNVKVADDKGRCVASVVAEGIRWAADHGAKVINLSLEFRSPSAELNEALIYAWNKGAIIVASGSNETSEEPVYPAYYSCCISVVATRQNNTIGPLANYPVWVDLAAPGFNIFSTLPGNKYGYKSGTSFAAAYVSGLAALLMPAATDFNHDGKVNDEVREAIEKGSVTLEASSLKVINAMNSINLITQGSNIIKID